MRRASILLCVLALGWAALGRESNAENKPAAGDAHLAKATFAGGCFWCMEPPFDRLDGVISTTSGYTGGSKKDPTYDEVSSGNTGHAESLEVVYDPSRVSYEQLLDVFWAKHDPTQLNRQGWDIGDNYRSAIFFNDEEQHEAAVKSKAGEQRNWGAPIVTQIEPAQTFYEAEDYHQQYLEKRGRSSCTPALKQASVAS